MSNRFLCFVSACALVIYVANAQGSSTSSSIEIQDLNTLKDELALVRGFAEKLKDHHAGEKRLQFRYDDVIYRLEVLEKDIEDHISYTWSKPKWERLGE